MLPRSSTRAITRPQCVREKCDLTVVLKEISTIREPATQTIGEPQLARQLAAIETAANQTRPILKCPATRCAHWVLGQWSKSKRLASTATNPAPSATTRYEIR